MAGINNVFAGAYTNLYYGAGGETDATAINTKIAEVKNIGTLEDSASEITVSGYGGDGYTRTLTGKKTAGPLALTLNWMPEDASHQALKAAYYNGARHAFKIEWLDSTKTQGNYAVFQGIVQSFSIDTPDDDAVTANVNILIDGGFTVSAKA